MTAPIFEDYALGKKTLSDSKIYLMAKKTSCPASISLATDGVFIGTDSSFIGFTYMADRVDDADDRATSTNGKIRIISPDIRAIKTHF